jgi:hypothetical protein
MASNPHGRKFDLIINGHKFEWPDQFITGKQIIELAGLSPDDPLEVLMKLEGKEFEPVELAEKKDLNEPGIEKFEINPVKKLIILLDDEEIAVPKCFMTPVEILALKNYKPEDYYLKQILGNKEITYKNDENHVIAIKCGMKFSTCKKGATGVS